MTKAYSMSPHNLADALGMVREEIKTLKAREASLRSALLDARINGPVAGGRFTVSVRESTRRSIDVNSLPASIRNDERFWKTSTTRTVLTKALPRTAPATREEDISLIEPY